MKKHVILPFFLLLLLVGCQSQTVSTEKLHDDSELILEIIKNHTLYNVEYSEKDSNLLNEFKSTYIDQYKNYSSSDQKLISDIEGLINSYSFLKVANGLKDADGIDMYQQRLDDSISKLDKQFNN